MTLSLTFILSKPESKMIKYLVQNLQLVIGVCGARVCAFCCFHPTALQESYAFLFIRAACLFLKFWDTSEKP